MRRLLVRRPRARPSPNPSGVRQPPVSGHGPGQGFGRGANLCGVVGVRWSQNVSEALYETMKLCRPVWDLYVRTQAGPQKTQGGATRQSAGNIQGLARFVRRLSFSFQHNLTAGATCLQMVCVLARGWAGGCNKGFRIVVRSSPSNVGGWRPSWPRKLPRHSVARVPATTNPFCAQAALPRCQEITGRRPCRWHAACPLAL